MTEFLPMYELDTALLGVENMVVDNDELRSIIQSIRHTIFEKFQMSNSCQLTYRIPTRAPSSKAIAELLALKSSLNSFAQSDGENHGATAHVLQVARDAAARCSIISRHMTSSMEEYLTNLTETLDLLAKKESKTCTQYRTTVVLPHKTVVYDSVWDPVLDMDP